MVSAFNKFDEWNWALFALTLAIVQALNRLADEACVRPRPLAMAITLEDSMLSGGVVVAVVVGGELCGLALWCPL